MTTRTIPIRDASSPTYAEAGALAARAMMAQYGHPDSLTWFRHNAPDREDPQAIAGSGRPVEFWQAVHDEIMSVGGTA